jgi:hypothetical protein
MLTESHYNQILSISFGLDCNKMGYGSGVWIIRGEAIRISWERLARNAISETGDRSEAKPLTQDMMERGRSLWKFSPCKILPRVMGGNV